MKLQVKKEFIDRHTGILHEVGEVFEANEDRLQEIRSVDDLVSVVEEKEEPVKKKRSRKKVSGK